MTEPLWDDADYYRYHFTETDDPRVLAVIQREDEYGGGHIDGDVYAPAFYWDRRWGHIDGTAGSTYMDQEAREIVEHLTAARDYFQSRRMPWETVERYLRIFWGTTMEQVTCHIDQSGPQVVILNTPGWREHVGLTEDRAFEPGLLKGDVDDWQAALDGDVYGIGWATNEARRLPGDEPIDLMDGSWDIEIECWGYLGEEYAKESAFAFECGQPNLPEMLEVA